MNSFNFNQSNNNNNNSSAFSFNASATQNKQQPVTSVAPSFSFGTSAAAPSISSTGFSFGNTNSTSTAPTFGLAGTASGNSQQSTGFNNLGGTSTSTAGTTSFSLPGSTGTTPAFNLGNKDAVKPGGFSFGGATATSSAPSFGFTPSQNTEATQKSNAPASTSNQNKSAFGGFSFGSNAVPSTPAQQSSNAAAVQCTPATSVDQGPLTLSALKTPAPASNTASTQNAGFKVPSLPSTTTKPEAATTASKAATPSFSFGNTSASTTAVAAPNLAQAKKADESVIHNVPIADISAYLKDKTLGEILNEWQNDLQESLSLFHRKANEIAEADSKILENSDKIYKLTSEAKSIDDAQGSILGTLNYIENQQNQLENDLNLYEEKLRASFAQSTKENADVNKLSKVAGNAQEQREKTYQMADSLIQEIFKIKEQINDIMSYSNNAMDFDGENNDEQATLLYVNKSLNEQFETLKRIDENSENLVQRFNELKEYRQLMEGEISKVNKAKGINNNYF